VYSGYRQFIAASAREQLLNLRLGTHLAFLVLPVQGLLHVDGGHASLRAASHAPTHSEAPQRVAHRRSDASSEVVFEVTVWKADDERPGQDKTSLFLSGLFSQAACPRIRGRKRYESRFTSAGTSPTPFIL
jgi:hypothetical protein